ncbi:NADPH oxidase 5-like isoform X2 [Mizuhopecten yessoensis]|uniref:NADPH oxidase 5-like isoform X2 n=1 Tax=Mizuhopecten yessoensis TaxID=6573 RepID=UPI000B45969A|nr:NADPH oxidase 5-like isoform X2 [Mizuhopecten yessoensis]
MDSTESNFGMDSVGKPINADMEADTKVETGMVNLAFESDDRMKNDDDTASCHSIDEAKKEAEINDLGTISNGTHTTCVNNNVNDTVSVNISHEITDLDDDDVHRGLPNGSPEDNQTVRIQENGGRDCRVHINEEPVAINVDSPNLPPGVNGQSNGGLPYKRNSSIPDDKDDVIWYEWITLHFKKISGNKGHITLKEFKEAFQIRKAFFAERFFQMFDENGSGSIELIELMTGLRTLRKGTPTEKLRFLFKVYDIDGSGYIDRNELNTVLRTSMEESSLTLGEDKLEKMTDAIFESADTDNSGELSFDELKAELEQYPGVMENLSMSAASWLKVPTGKQAQKSSASSRYLTTTYYRNNCKKIVFLIIYILVNIALGCYAAYNYKDSNGWYILARICGMNLNFNGTFIIVLMLRKSLTYLRLTFLHRLLPIDQNIYFHKLCGAFIAFFSFFHTVGHIGNAFVVVEELEHMKNATTDMHVWEVLLTTKAGIGFVGASAFITGWMLDVVLVIMVICSLPFVRRSGHFEVFYWSHMLYIAFWVLLILHAPNFWKWFIAPGIIFMGEKFFRSKFVKRVRYGTNHIQEVTILPSGVTQLVISKGDKFHYKPGDYCFIQIPCIAQYEWHPFTISSAPEMSGKFTLHIRSAGHWTNKLYEYFENLDPGLGNTFDDEEDVIPKGRGMSRRGTRGRSLYKSVKGTFQRSEKNDEQTLEELKAEKRRRRKHKKVKILCSIDGPYGTGCREVFDTEHAVLIGAGIGVTPMASILQSVMFRYKASKRQCPNCNHEFYGEISEHSMKLKKVDFIWINRDQKCFEWFMSMLTELEMEQAELDRSDSGSLDRIIDMQFYMTSVKDLTDMKGIGLQLAMDLLHKKDNKDLITGLHTRTQAGRPKWSKVFKGIAAQKKGKVKVFFCGAPALGKIIKLECEKINFSFSKENF